MWLDRTLFERKSMPAPRVRISPSERLLRAVRALAGSSAELVSHTETPWVSVTFAGSRHTMVLRYTGWEACDDAEHFKAQLPAHEFAIPGVLVADAAASMTNQVLLPEPWMEIEVDLLLLDD